MGRSAGSIRGLGVFVEFPLIIVPPPETRSKILLQRRFSITRENPKLVNTIAGEDPGPYGHYKHLPRETRAKKDFSPVESNAKKMRSKKVFDFGIF